MPFFRAAETFPSANTMNVRFSIKTKIFFVILAPALLLLFVIYLDYANLSALGRSAGLILSKNYKSIQAAQQVRQLLEENRNRVLMTLFDRRAPGTENLSTDPGRGILSLLQGCRDNITETGERDIIERLFNRFEKYEPLLRVLLEEETDGPDLLYYDFFALTASFVSDVNDLVLLNEKAMEAADRNTREMAARALRYSMGLLVSAIFFTVVFSLILSRRISSPLTRLARSLATIREGSGDYPRLAVAARDEIGFLTSELNRIFERLKAYDQLSLDKLTAERLKVRQAEEAKARFIADLSHQLKTPMTSLSMSVGLLAEKGENLGREKTAKLMETARDDCARLSALINELVDIARMDAMLKPRPKEFLHIGQVIQECLKPLRHQSEDRNIRIQTEIQPDLPPVAIDSLRFPWVITNLVGNAIRYTERGGVVTLRVEMKGKRFYFRCIDSGTGIDEKYLIKIFDRYTQFSEREKSGAIGLGLAIVKEIIEQHGGDITVESQVGRGTTFTFWLPAREEEHK